MNKEKYNKLSIDIDGTISLLQKDYHRKARKWNLPDEQIDKVQEQIRNLKHMKQMAWESMAVEEDLIPRDLLEMLRPILVRRETEKHYFVISESGEVTEEVRRNLDGRRFTFDPKSDAYQPKHLKGFWSCPACMVDTERFVGIEMPEIAAYKRKVVWCPRFAVAFAKDVDEAGYRERVHGINPEAPICFAGLLHAEFQVTATEAKYVQKCDTCGYRTEEIKELAEPTGEFDVSVDLGKGETMPLAVRMNCSECEALLFEGMKGDKTDEELKAILDDHYKEKHPDWKDNCW